MNTSGIMLSRIKLSYPEMRIALLKILDNDLSIENLKAIKQYVPTNDEVRTRLVLSLQRIER